MVYLDHVQFLFLCVLTMVTCIAIVNAVTFVGNNDDKIVTFGRGYYGFFGTENGLGACLYLATIIATIMAFTHLGPGIRDWTAQFENDTSTPQVRFIGPMTSSPLIRHIPATTSATSSESADSPERKNWSWWVTAFLLWLASFLLTPFIIGDEVKDALRNGWERVRASGSKVVKRGSLSQRLAEAEEAKTNPSTSSTTTTSTANTASTARNTSLFKSVVGEFGRYLGYDAIAEVLQAVARSLFRTIRN